VYNRNREGELKRNKNRARQPISLIFPISTKIGDVAMTAYRGEDMIGDNGYGTTEHALKSAHDALRAIANMQVKEDKGEVLELCMSIARLELEKCRMNQLQKENE
jgi:hypothetical protein